MSSHKSLHVTCSAISLPESASGLTHSGLLVGQTIEKSGLAAALANLSPRMAKEKGLLTSGICGQAGTTSSQCAALSAFMASKLRVKTDLLGSTLYKLTWKPRTTPSGQLIYALRASALRTSGNDCTSWPTPTARDYKDGYECLNVELKGILGRVVWLTNWTLDAPESWKREGGAALSGPVRRTATGRKLTGSAAKMAGGGQLRAGHSRWLMGLPIEWEKSAPTATP